MTFAFARSGSCCNFSAWSAKSSAEAHRASASVYSAVPSFSLSTHLLHHSQLSSSDLQQRWLSFFLVFQVSWVFVPSTCTVQQQLFVTNIDVVNTANWLNVSLAILVTCTKLVSHAVFNWAPVEQLYWSTSTHHQCANPHVGIELTPSKNIKEQHGYTRSRSAEHYVWYNKGQAVIIPSCCTKRNSPPTPLYQLHIIQYGTIIIMEKGWN